MTLRLSEVHISAHLVMSTVLHEQNNYCSIGLIKGLMELANEIHMPIIALRHLQLYSLSTKQLYK